MHVRMRLVDRTEVRVLKNTRRPHSACARACAVSTYMYSRLCRPHLRRCESGSRACGCVLELAVCRVRFARVSCPRLRFVCMGTLCDVRARCVELHLHFVARVRESHLRSPRGDQEGRSGRRPLTLLLSNTTQRRAHSTRHQTWNKHNCIGACISAYLS